MKKRKVILLAVLSALTLSGNAKEISNEPYNIDAYVTSDTRLYSDVNVEEGTIIETYEKVQILDIYNDYVFVKYNNENYQDMDVNDLTIEDIRNVQTDFIKSAQIFKYGDFDGIQLGLGNNNFLARFINPFFNKRKDEYGGNRFNRVKIVLEIIKVLKNNYGLHVSCKINAFDDKHDGITEDESIEIAKLLEKYGADSIQITKPTSPAFFTRKNKTLKS